jgi:bacteriorhodopsin
MQLEKWQYDLVYNSFSLVIAGMGSALLFFLLSRNRVGERHRSAIIVSSLVVAVAAYHYFRIFNSWEDAFEFDGTKYISKGAGFNEGYRYVDWLITVPLLLAELVLALKLSGTATRKLIVQLSVAAIAMIVLGYPGEIADADASARTIWGVLSTIPFLFILYTLFVQLGKEMGEQSATVRKLLDGLRYIILATWGVYPLAYMAKSLINDEATAEVTRQVGYAMADLLAKPLFGLLVFAIAMAKTRDDEKFAATFEPVSA